MPQPPNVLYIHSHDTGRFVQPYGYQVPTPNIQMLADQGVFFRQAFCAAPTCSGSRASLLIGEQHISKDPAVIGFDQVIDVDSNHTDDVAPAANAILGDIPEPFFLSVGF